MFAHVKLKEQKSQEWLCFWKVVNLCSTLQAVMKSKVLDEVRNEFGVKLSKIQTSRTLHSKKRFRQQLEASLIIKEQAP